MIPPNITWKDRRSIFLKKNHETRITKTKESLLIGTTSTISPFLIAVQKVNPVITLNKPANNIVVIAFLFQEKLMKFSFFLLKKSEIKH